MLIESGWRFECEGCSRWVNSDLEGYHAFHGRKGLLERLIRLKPVYGPRSVYCCPSCKTRSEKDKRTCKEMETAVIEDFKARVLKRFPGVAFTKGDGYGGPHAYANKENDLYVIRQVIVHFGFPGQKIAPATFRFDMNCQENPALIGPRAPQFWCRSGDRDAFEAFARGEPLKEQVAA